jgi:nucleoside-diphosphate-sugar epimerase
MVERGMKILISGGAGFIGHNVVRRLESLGNEVIIQDNLTTYGIVDEALLNRLMTERLAGVDAKLIESDITTNITRTHIDIHKPDIIIHLAAFPRAKIVNENPEEGVPTMTTGLMNLLTAGARNNLKRFVYISSSMVYGDFYGSVPETHVCKPGSIYASLKLAGEQITKQFAKKHDFEYTIVRPSAVYGPRDVEDRVVSKFLINAMNDNPLWVHGSGEVLDFSYVGDVADGIVAAALNENGANETFNITFGRAEFIEDVAHIITTIANKGEIRITNRNASMPTRGTLNIAKAQKLLDYNPKVDIEEGFKIYYDWAQKFYSI